MITITEKKKIKITDFNVIQLSSLSLTTLTKFGFSAFKLQKKEINLFCLPLN